MDRRWDKFFFAIITIHDSSHTFLKEFYFSSIMEKRAIKILLVLAKDDVMLEKDGSLIKYT
jgi:hypothetical protein